jgi:hypothetical protein
MNTTADRMKTAADLAGILARGYDQHIAAHGPDGSYAVRTEDGGRYEVTETAAGATSYVERDGERFAVAVTPLTRVTDLYVGCSYPMRPDAIAASDNCRHPANTAVRDAAGNLWWRCPTHEGELRNGVYGEEVVTHVPAEKR